MPDNKQKVALYLRVSTQQQDTELQRRELVSFTQAKGWRITRIYEEKVSGTTTNRPMLKRLMRDAAKKKFSIVVVWKLDRFARSLKDLLSLLDDLGKSGVAFVSQNDQIDMSSPASKLLFHLIGAFAEFEASLIRSRVMAGLENARRKGKRLGRTRTRDDDAINALRAKGLSVRKIAAELKISKGSVQRSLAECTRNPSKS